MSLFLKLYSPEGFLIFSTISLLVFNSIIITTPKYKFPILNFEILHQCFTIVFFTLLLTSNMSMVSIGHDLFFYTTYSSKYLKILLLVVFLSSFLLIWRSFVLQKLNFFEYFIILLLILVGLLFLINAYNLISIYLCLEIQAIGFYILSAFNRSSIFSSEAGLKYFISSSLFSGVFLLGAALVYGSLGTLNLYQQEFLLLNFFEQCANFPFFFFLIGHLLIICTLLFKLVIAPFQFWFPSIYDGSPISSTIVFSILPKVALVNLFLICWSSVFGLLAFFDTTFFFIGVYSLFFGIIKMLKQKRLKKVYIYSSISQMGLLLCILVDNSYNSINSIYFFLCIYLLTSILLWLIFVLICSNQIAYNNSLANYPLFISSFHLLFKHNKIFAISVCFVFFSLAAIPPFCGFLSKTYIYLILIKNLKYEAAVFLIYLGTFGVYYYIKFLKVIFFENATLYRQTQIHNFYPTLYLNLDSTLCAVILMLLFYLSLYPNILLYFCSLLFF